MGDCITSYYQLRSITRKLIQAFELIMQRLKTNVLMDWDTFLRSVNQSSLLSFSIHFLRRNLTSGLTHILSHSNHEETHLRNTTLTQLSL